MARKSLYRYDIQYQLTDTAAVLRSTQHGISVEVRSEAWTSQECPQCGSTERTTRHQDTLTCPCGFEEHADLTASETFLRRHQNSESSGWRTRHEVSRQRHTEQAVRPMARPVSSEI